MSRGLRKDFGGRGEQSEWRSYRQEPEGRNDKILKARGKILGRGEKKAGITENDGWSEEGDLPLGPGAVVGDSSE